MGRTINYAVKNLQKETKEAILRAWEAANCMDLYDGKLSTYIQVIAQTLERQNKKIRELDNIIAKAQAILSRGG